MRIVIDMQGAQTESRFRGIGRYTLSFAQAVVRNRGEHEVILVLSGLFPDTIEPIRAAFEGVLSQENIRVWYAPGPVKEEQSGNETRRKVAELMREAFIASLQPDIVHIPSLFEGYVDNAVTSIGHFDKKTIVSVTLHDLIPLLSPDQYLKPNPTYSAYYHRKLESLKKASLFLAISESSKREVIDCLNVDEATVINTYEGVDPHFCILDAEIFSSQSLLDKFGVNKPFLLYTGGSDERKNLPRLIQAYAALNKELRKEHQLVFAGKMPEGDVARFKAIAARCDLQQHELIFTGYITDDELVILYNICKLYVFPSFHEGFGLPALEAMVCGAPVIGANTTSLPEVIGLNIALFDPFDVVAMTEKINHALTDKEFRQQLRDHALNQIKKFSWDIASQLAINTWEKKCASTTKKLWSNWKKEQENIYSHLCELLAGTISRSADEVVDDQYLRLCANAIGKNQKTLENYWRPKELPEILKWRFEGPFDSSYSLALLNRELAKAMHELGHDVALHSTEGPGDFEPSQQFLNNNPVLNNLNKRAKELTSLDADVCSRNLYPPRVTGMNAAFNIMHGYGWEESAFPNEWVDNFNDYLQGMTVMSAHCKKVFIDSGVFVPVSISSIGVDHWERVKPVSDFSLSAKSFRFLHVSSCFPRKGADVMLKAYGMAFTSKDNVSLVIKTFPNPHNEIHKWLEEARSEFNDYPDVVLIESDLSDSQLKALYEQCHVLLAPSRAEGFGLPMAEAMLSNLAVLTTGWSGQTDFCTPETSWLIDYDFEWANTHFNLFSSVWANPKANHMAELMLEVYNLPEIERKERSFAGRKLLLDNFKWTDVAQKNVEFIRYIAKNNDFSEEYAKVAWVSSWNTRCGIAAYSEHLVGKMQSDICIYAQRSHELVGVDSNNVLRCWDMNDQERLEDLSTAISNQDPDVVVVQFNYGFFNIENFAAFLDEQVMKGRNVVVMLHSTVDPKHAPHKKLSILVPSLKKMSRVLVHSPGDLNRLKSYGLIDNVALFPHGIIDHQSTIAERIEQTRPVTLASYGFFLPHKGLFELIHAVSILRNNGHDVRLVMVNSEFPALESINAVVKAKNLISKLNLEPYIELHTNYLSDDQSLSLLEKANLVIFPYQNTGESSSAAVRYGIVSERDIAVTPLDIFDDVSTITYRLPGCSPEEIALGVEQWLRSCLGENNDLIRIRENAKSWRDQHRYSVVAKRLDYLLKALCIKSDEYSKSD